MDRRSRIILVAALGASGLLAGVGAGAATASAPAGATTPDEPRPTPFVVAQHLVELGADRPLQWQVATVQLGAAAAPLTASANLFVLADDPLLLVSDGASLGSVLSDADEAVAVPAGSRWTLLAPTGAAAVTIFGLGNEDGGTAPAGEPFTPAASGWHQLEVRGYQLLPGELVEVGDDSAATLLIGRAGVSTTTTGELVAGATLTTTRTTIGNDGEELAVFVAATVTAVSDEVSLAALNPATETVPPSTTPPTTEPQDTTTSTASPTAPPSPTPTPTDPPTTTEGPRAPAAVNDSRTLYDGRALIDANGSATITMNVMSNDDRGNPQGVVVSVDGSESNVGQTLSGGPGSTRIDADGTATFSTSFHNPAYSVSHSVQYEIENEHGRSMAVASFEIVFCPEGQGGSC